MRVRSRKVLIRRLLALAMVPVVAAAAVLVFIVLSGRDRSDSPIQTVLEILGAAGTVLTGLFTWRKNIGDSPEAKDESVFDRAVAEVAAQADLEWRQIAAQKNLVNIRLPTTWELDRPLVSGVADGRARRPPFSRLPLPGRLEPLTPAELQEGGGRKELYSIYGALPFGRLVITGGAGSGKSASAVLLAIDVLDDRREATAAQQALLPVPVLLTAGSWDTRSQNLVQWVTAQLLSRFPFLNDSWTGFQGEQLVGRLLAERRVSIFLDGLEGFPQAMHHKVLEALSQADFRVVLLARREVLPADLSYRFPQSVVIAPQPVDAETARDYLDKVRPQPRDESWGILLERLRHEPEGQLARDLSSPLILNLVWLTSEPGDPAPAILVLDVLLRRVVPARFADRVGEPSAYPATRANATLSLIAERMSAIERTDHRSAWRRLLEGLGGPTRKVARHEDLSHGDPNEFAWWAMAQWCPPQLSLVATVLVIAGTAGLYGGPVALLGGIGIGVLAWVVLNRGAQLPVRLVAPRWKPDNFRRLLVVAAFIGGLSGLDYTFDYGLRAGLAVLAVTGLAAAVIAAVESAMTGSLVAAPGDTRKIVDPRTCWRNDWWAGMVRGLLSGTIYGFLTGLGYGLIGPLVYPVMKGGLAHPMFAGVTGVIGGVGGVTLYWSIWGVILGATFGLVYSRTWPTRLAFLYFWWAEGTPLRLMKFLDHAVEVEVMRIQGPKYLFFHDTLRESLARSAAEATGTQAPVDVAGAAATPQQPRIIMVMADETGTPHRAVDLDLVPEAAPDPDPGRRGRAS